MITIISVADLSPAKILEVTLKQGDIIKFDSPDVEVIRDGYSISLTRGENESAFYAKYDAYYATQYGAFEVSLNGASDEVDDIYEAVGKSKESDTEYTTIQTAKKLGGGGGGNSYTKTEIDSKLSLKADQTQLESVNNKVDTLKTRVDTIEASGGGGGAKVYSNFPPLPKLYDTSSNIIAVTDDANKWTAKNLLTTDSTIMFEGKSTIKFSHAVGQTSPYGSLVLATPINLTGFDYIEMNVYIVGGINFGPNSNLRFHSADGSFKADLYRYINSENGQKEGWKRIRINKSDFSINDGTPDWSAINKIFIAFTISQSAVASVNVANILNLNVETGILNIDFDDSLESVYKNALPIMNKYNLKGSIYAITSRVGTPGYLTWGQLQELRTAGWTIGSHTDQHQDLATLTREQIIKEFDDSQRKLRQHGFYSGSYFIAAPQGKWSDLAREEALTRFLYARVFRQVPNLDSIPCDDSLLSGYRSVLKADTVDKVKGEVDAVIANKQGFNMTFHDIGATVTGNWDWPPENFEALCQYIAEKRDAGVLKVLTAEEKVLQFSGQECNFKGTHSLLSSDGTSPVVLKLNRN